MHDLGKIAFRMLSLAVACLTLVDAQRASAEDQPPADEKRIVVDKTTFSDLYPAVWFSPSTGEIAPLKVKSEIPPDEKYEIWIEPRDPEFAFGPEKKPPGVGFQLLGKGNRLFQEAAPPKKPELSPDLEKLMRDLDGTETPVFYCQARNSACLIMISTLDKQNQVIAFGWRPLQRSR